MAQSFNSAQDAVAAGYGGYAGWSPNEMNADIAAGHGQDKFTGGSNSNSSTDGLQSKATNAENTAGTNFNNLLGSYQNQTDTLNKNFTAAIPGIESNAASTAAQTYDLPTLAKTANDLGTRISQLTNNTDNQGGGGMSGNNIMAGVNARLLPQYNQAESNLASESQGYNGLFSALTSLGAAPYTTAADILKTNMQSGISGLTATQESQLRAITDQLDQGVSLSNNALQYAEALAAAKLSAGATIAAAQSQHTYENIPAGSYEFNTNTGAGQRVG